MINTLKKINFKLNKIKVFIKKKTLMHAINIHFKKQINLLSVYSTFDLIYLPINGEQPLFFFFDYNKNKNNDYKKAGIQ